MALRNYAKYLGRRGGLARAKKLSTDHKKEIASSGGKARSQSLRAAKRIDENFRYFEAIQELSGNK